MTSPFPPPHRPGVPELRCTFALPRPLEAALRTVGAHRWLWVRVLGGMLDVRFGPWRVSTPLDNVAGAEVGGPYAAWKALGPRMSAADRGLTFGTSTAAGVCIRFHRPVRGLEPFRAAPAPGADRHRRRPARARGRARPPAGAPGGMIRRVAGNRAR